VHQVSEPTATRTFAPLPGEDGELLLLDAAAERKRDGYFLVTVELNGTVYTGRAKADAAENFDPATLATSEMIAACINDTQMVLDRLDGTDFRARVVRVEHRLSRTFLEAGQGR
jgi:hypothetical protein